VTKKEGIAAQLLAHFDVHFKIFEMEIDGDFN
jgi:hypothetical protein